MHCRVEWRFQIGTETVVLVTALRDIEIAEKLCAINTWQSLREFVTFLDADGQLLQDVKSAKHFATNFRDTQPTEITYPQKPLQKGWNDRFEP